MGRWQKRLATGMKKSGEWPSLVARRTGTSEHTMNPGRLARCSPRVRRGRETISSTRYWTGRVLPLGFLPDGCLCRPRIETPSTGIAVRPQERCADRAVRGREGPGLQTVGQRQESALALEAARRVGVRRRAEAVQPRRVIWFGFVPVNALSSLGLSEGPGYHCCPRGQYPPIRGRTLVRSYPALREG